MSAEPILDRNVFAEAKSMMQSRFERLLAGYLEDTGVYIEQMRAVLGRQDVGAMVAPAHTIKSSSQCLGAMQLAALAREIEHECRAAVKGSGSLETLPARLEKLQAVFEETKKALQEN